MWSENNVYFYYSCSNGKRFQGLTVWCQCHSNISVFINNLLPGWLTDFYYSWSYSKGKHYFLTTFWYVVHSQIIVPLLDRFIRRRSNFPFQNVMENSVHKQLLTLLGRGGPALFSDGYSSMKKGVWRSKIPWLFLIHYKLSENQKKIWFFTEFWGDP